MHQLTLNGYTKISDNWDSIYAAYLEHLLDRGDLFTGRNGETRSSFGCSVTADLRWGFPLTRLRKMPWKNLVREFLFDIGFNTNVEALGKAKHFWDFLADENGELGASAYCRQWRQWPASASGVEVPNERLVTEGTVDQLLSVVTKLIENPNSRQGTVITHNPTAIDPGCPPCHIAMHFAPSSDGSLDLLVPARSNDMVVGFPLDIARYALMLTVVARAVSMNPRFVYMPSANSHIYSNCYDTARLMIKRPQRDECAAVINPDWDKQLGTLSESDFSLLRYDPHEAMKVEVN